MPKLKRVYGWKPDLPDMRDHLFTAKRRIIAEELPRKVDLREKCSPVEDQGQIGSCTAQAIVGCLECLEISRTKVFTDLSRLFLYYKERELENSVNIDQGAYIRDGIKVLAKIGVPHEDLWPYNMARWAEKPTAEAHRGAKQHKITDYQRMSSLQEMKSCLAAGYPFVFGFSVYDYFESKKMAETGVLVMPKGSERVLGGHAVTAVGYDDDISHFIVRNSWSTKWGQKGYFMMPYEYLADRNLSDDFWSIRK